MRGVLFKTGALALAICSVFLLFAAAGTLFLKREFTDDEKMVAFVGAAMLGAGGFSCSVAFARRQ